MRVSVLLAPLFAAATLGVVVLGRGPLPEVPHFALSGAAMDSPAGSGPGAATTGADEQAAEPGFSLNYQYIAQMNLIQNELKIKEKFTYFCV